MKRRGPLTAEEIKAAITKLGRPMASQIAEEIGCSRAAVWLWVKKHGSSHGIVATQDKTWKNYITYRLKDKT